MPGGTIRPESPFYVERPADLRVRQAIRVDGVTVTIKGPRQIGKSSVLAGAMAAASEVGKRVLYLDFQEFQLSQPEALASADMFFRHFGPAR